MSLLFIKLILKFRKNSVLFLLLLLLFSNILYSQTYNLGVTKDGAYSLLIENDALKDDHLKYQISLVPFNKSYSNACSGYLYLIKEKINLNLYSETYTIEETLYLFSNGCELEGSLDYKVHKISKGSFMEKALNIFKDVYPDKFKEIFENRYSLNKAIDLIHANLFVPSKNILTDLLYRELPVSFQNRAKYNLGICHYRLNEFNEAISLFNELKRSGFKDKYFLGYISNAYYKLGIIYFNNKDFQKALYNFNKSLDECITCNKNDHFLKLLEIHFYLDNIRDAEKLSERIKNLNNQNNLEKIYLMCSVINLQNDNKSNAILLFQKFLKYENFQQTIDEYYDYLQSNFSDITASNFLNYTFNLQKFVK